MTYLRVKWKQTNPDYPILLYSELDDDRLAIAGVGVHGNEIGLLTGEVLEINNDSSTLGVHDIVWDAEGVTVMEDGASPRMLARCVIRNGTQCWTNYRLVRPLATTTTSQVSSPQPEGTPKPNSGLRVAPVASTLTAR